VQVCHGGSTEGVRDRAATSLDDDHSTAVAAASVELLRGPNDGAPTGPIDVEVGHPGR
jgi:hypothetical protein